MAHDLTQSALAIYAKIYDGYDIVVARVYHNMVKIYFELGKEERAWKNY